MRGMRSRRVWSLEQLSIATKFHSNFKGAKKRKEGRGKEYVLPNTSLYVNASRPPDCEYLAPSVPLSLSFSLDLTGVCVRLNNLSLSFYFVLFLSLSLSLSICLCNYWQARCVDTFSATLAPELAGWIFFSNSQCKPLTKKIYCPVHCTRQIFSFSHYNVIDLLITSMVKETIYPSQTSVGHVGRNWRGKLGATYLLPRLWGSTLLWVDGSNLHNTQTQSEWE